MLDGKSQPHVLKTLQEDIDDLDRMVDGDAQKAAIRSQIRLISREVASLETDLAHVIKSNEQLIKEKAAVDAELAKLKNPPPDRPPNRIGTPTGF